MKRLKAIHSWWQSYGECFTIPAIVVWGLTMTCIALYYYQQARLK